MAEPVKTQPEAADAQQEAQGRSGADSTAHRKDQTPDQTAETHSTGDPNGSQPSRTAGVGDVPPVSASSPPADDPDARTRAREVTKRLQLDGRWPEVQPIRDQMMQDKALKARLPDKESRQAWVYKELDRMYPPVQQNDGGIRTYDEVSAPTRKFEGETSASTRNFGDQIQGLGDLPEVWPELPANASLGAEIGWVQANRLLVVEERPGAATRVRLERALGPAPSWSALGWLETSIRSYAKFVDVAAKASGGTDDEGAVLRAERRSVDDVKALLDEMRAAAGTCPACGRDL